MRKFIAAALLAGTVFAAPASATVTYYYSQAAFLAALGATVPTVEDFNDTTLVPGLSILSTVGTVDAGDDNVFDDRLVPNTQSTTFLLPGSFHAFGGFWDLTPGGAGLGIAITPVPGATLGTEVPNSFSGGFFGFISSDAFNYVVLTAGTQGGVAETYKLDDLTFGNVGPAVPEPATWGMMIVGLGVAGMAMRRRATKVSFA
ncbi:PEPxxWA-CTERM sorting domain-containing protein [Sphingobium nicotianae]|uniref:PEP-CTERM sorting domain-containing protein n=1 Tax=Sphingobium nicotianae TaxID=2782607 RepID=A0A9X1DB65_9SPHN|nr:PEPxxWA-CTERM sorting domain-containing protein [Sphingobium nicotianae]MBT2186727.1 PEP-CTERM sorting domain-containing protein [Sphingobium nicotianae]